MPRSSYGSGTIFKARQDLTSRFRLTASNPEVLGLDEYSNAKKFREQILGKKARGEIVFPRAGKVTCGELLDDLSGHDISDRVSGTRPDEK